MIAAAAARLRRSARETPIDCAHASALAPRPFPCGSARPPPRGRVRRRAGQHRPGHARAAGPPRSRQRPRSRGLRRRRRASASRAGTPRSPRTRPPRSASRSTRSAAPAAPPGARPSSSTRTAARRCSSSPRRTRPASLAEGCATAVIDQDPIDVSIQVKRFNPPSCCGDGSSRPASSARSRRPQASKTCSGLAADAVCGADCTANEILLSIDDPTLPLFNNGAEGDEDGFGARVRAGRAEVSRTRCARSSSTPRSQRR